MGLRTPGWGQQDGDRDTRMRMGTLELECMDLLTSSIKSPRAASFHHTDLGTSQIVSPPGGNDSFFPLQRLGVTPSDPSVAPGSFSVLPGRPEPVPAQGTCGKRGAARECSTHTLALPDTPGRGVLQEEHTEILISQFCSQFSGLFA